jgi:MoaA/NifB/PqqE/SkfB family radical SAM enzyme
MLTLSKDKEFIASNMNENVTRGFDVSKRLMRKILPGGLTLSEQVLGTKDLFAMILRTAWAYKRTISYSLKKKGIKAAANFLFVKVFVPIGEGSGAAAFFFLGPLIRRFPQLAPYPYNVEIEITTRCNKRCTICEHTYWNEPSIDLSFEDFKKIVDQIPKLKWVNLTGEGDAFLNKDYLKMIRHLKSKNIPVYLVDSFDLINEKTAEELVKMGVDGIYVSFDGATKETYEKIKVGCSFDRSLKNIRNLIELKKKMNSPVPELCFRYVVTTLNVNEMPKFVELVSSFGARESLGDGSRIEYCGLLVFDEIEHYYVPKIPESILKTTVIKKRELNVDVMFCHTEPHRFPSINNCLAWMEPYIMMGGYVLPCCAVLMSNKRDFLRKHCLGNILKTPLKDIWYSERYKRFRYTVNKPNAKVPLLCAGCRAYDTTAREQKYGVDMTL